MSKGPLATMSNLDASKVQADPAQSPAKEKSSMAEIKNNKVVFKQKLHSFEKHSETLQELVKFREMIQQLVTSGSAPMTELEAEYKPLIIKLAYESDKTLPALAKHIKSQLLPSEDEDDDEVNAAAASQVLPATTIEKAIRETMERNNYGLESDLTNKLPSSVCVWRWETKEQYRDCLPKNAQEKVATRLAERLKAKHELLSAFQRLPESEQHTILHIKPGSKPIVKESDTAASSASSSGLAAPPDETAGKGPDDVGKSKTADTEASSSKPKAARPKKAENAEKVAKAKKEKDAQKSLMANFFAKPKGKAVGTSAVKLGQPSTSRSQTSDFEKIFKPFVRKKDADIAPHNHFTAQDRITSSGSRDDIIILDSDDDPFMQSTSCKDVAHLAPKDRLRDVLSVMPKRPRYRPPRLQTSTRYKTHYSPSVRELMSQLSEAEVTGDASLVRMITQKLADRDVVPAKVLIFSEDLRPGYFGTWTRSSRIVGSRTPFAKDVLDIDYGYDSGEDWDEAESGGGDDVVDDDEEDVESEAQDSDMDDWLVDDEDIEQGPMPEEPIDFPPLPNAPLPTKRKADDKKAEEDKKAAKKRKVVVPLVPYAKGPCWETSVGHSEDSVLSPYQIRFLNDASFSIDPFTFVSTSQPERTQNAEPLFAIPAVPTHRTSEDQNQHVSAVKKIPAPAPKTAFPDDHLPVLLDKVNTLQTNSLAVLVDTIYQELKIHKVKKNAIEAKVKEIGVKSREKKYWVVRDQPIPNNGC